MLGPPNTKSKASPGRPKAAPAGAELPTALEWRWTVMQVAVFHQMKPGAVRAAIERGDLEAEQDGKDYKIRDSEYRRWVRGLSTSGRRSFLQKEGQ